MISVVGVRFKQAGKIYYFSPGELQIELGQKVLVETSRGIELGEVAEQIKQVSVDDVVQPLKQVVRIATESDFSQAESNRRDEQEAFTIAQQKIEQHELDMKLVDVEYTFDRSKLVFYFTSDKRVDFRELVKELASCFRTRIELRQIGVRDEAKMVGGLGICGRALCCSDWMSDFAPVSIRQAKDQDLAMNPNKISGVCSRLKCCLRFEAEVYEDARNVLPKLGDQVMTPAGAGRVVAVHVLRGLYVAQAEEGPRFVMGANGQVTNSSSDISIALLPSEEPCTGNCEECCAPPAAANTNNKGSKRKPHAKNSNNRVEDADKATDEIAAVADTHEQANRKRRRWKKNRLVKGATATTPKGEVPEGGQ